MDINAFISDQRLESVSEAIKEQAAEELGLKKDGGRLKSLAFVYLCVQSLLDLDEESTFDCLYDLGKVCYFKLKLAEVS
jgi:hypothetical protein